MSHRPTELWKWDAVDAARSIRLGEISSVELVTACLSRLDAVNPHINAVVVPLHEKALAQAREADAARARGDRLGPLHGVPVTIKINVDQKGEATSNGVVAWRDLIAPDDSPVVANFRRAGAVFLGRTNTPAFSSRWVTDNDLFGCTLNPWSRAHTAGGSSGGASASVAAGITAIGHGNDLAGSVRYPAYCTGIAGLRPSFGRVPAFLPSARSERPPSVQWMSVQGPLARRVADLRLALQVMSGGDPRDPWWVPAPLDWPADPAPPRVAMAVDPTGTGVHPAVAAAVRHAAQILQRAGHVVEEVELPDFAAIAEDWHTLQRFEAPEFMMAAVREFGDEDIRRALHWHMECGPQPDASAYLQAVARRTTSIRRWSMFLERYPLVLCPVSLAPPFPLGADTSTLESFQEVVRFQAPNFVVPVLGLPAVSVPTGVADGLPMGVQLIAARFREDRVLAAAELIEAACPMTTPLDPRG